MKKIYQTPRLRSIDIDMQQIIATSDETIPVDKNEGNGADAGSSLSRDNSTLWDNEW